MKELKTISSLEIAEMLEISHKEILRKLEGGHDRKGYIQILTEHQMVPSEYFIPDTYKDASGKENRCYQFTRLGCDFIANKFTGEKGVLFTAAYVKRFYEMEHAAIRAPKTENLPGVAAIVNVTRKVMKDQGHSPAKIAEQTKLIYEAYGVPMVDNFVKPTYEQLVITTTTTETKFLQG